MSRLDDEMLTRSLASDLDGGFEGLVRTYQDRLYAFALRLTGSPRDAEEVAQDAFVRAYRALARYPTDRVAALKLRAWLFQVTVNVVRNRARARRLAEVPFPASDDGRESFGDRPDAEDERPEQAALRRDEQARLAAIVAGLPERYRAAVVLRHIQGLSYPEVAAALGQPVGTVKSNVHRGVAALRAALDAAGLGPDAAVVAVPPTSTASTTTASLAAGRTA